MTKKLLIDNGGFDEKLPNWQDYDLWLKLSDFIDLKIIRKPLGTYYQNEKSITSRPYYKKLPSNLKVYYRYRHYAKFDYVLIKLLKIMFSKNWIR